MPPLTRWLRWLPRSLANEIGYSLLRPPKRRGRVAPTQATIEAILSRLANDGITVREVRVSPAEYHDYVERAGYRTRYSSYYPSNRAEKALEHFLAQRLLNLTSADVYIDVASERSPVPEIYQRLFGCRTYAQDLEYPGGINGGLIGGDAAAMPVPDGFATALGLHCSFEHFEGDSDRRAPDGRGAGRARSRSRQHPQRDGDRPELLRRGRLDHPARLTSRARDHFRAVAGGIANSSVMEPFCSRRIASRANSVGLSRRSLRRRARSE